MVDKSLFGMMGNFAPTGVTSQLVQNVRKALDVEYLTHVQIMVSGGFTEEKIYKFENEETCPNYVNAYAVGSSLLQGNYDFTADIVMVNGKAMSKVGREYNPHKNLTKVNWDEI
jgi:nicotinate phosphoribosyltransferase